MRKALRAVISAASPVAAMVVARRLTCTPIRSRRLVSTTSGIKREGDAEGEHHLAEDERLRGA